MDMPEVKKCCGVFCPWHATYLIALFGLASGACGIATIVLFGVAEDRIMAHFSKDPLTQEVKKTFLMTVGLSSLLLFVASALIFIGVVTKAPGALASGYLVIFAMCVLLLACAMAAPIACFFFEESCLVKQIPSIATTLFIIVLTVYVEIWLYFMAVVWNHEQEIGG